MSSLDTLLSSSITVGQYRKLEAEANREEIARFVKERFDERYFLPIESTPIESRHGFTILAVGCLVIETLESFYQGLGDTFRKGRQMFEAFFNRDTPLKVFGGDGNWFYEHIRCGILHQAETRGGWLVRRDGIMLDKSKREINATIVLRELRAAVNAYADQLQTDDDLWGRFKVKMNVVCKNCEIP